MTAWPGDELIAVGDADELQIASQRPDGTIRPYVTIWVVRVGADIYVRSAHGRDNPWFRRALSSGYGRIDADGVTRDVRFEEPSADAGLDSAIDAAFHAKYDHYGAPLVDPVVSDESARATLRIVPV